MTMTNERKVGLINKFTNNPNKLEQQLQSIEDDLNDSKKPVPDVLNVAETLINNGHKLYQTGYVFKPSHDEIHYVKKGATGDLRRSYSHNFTTNKNDALAGTNIEKAKSVIVDLVKKFPADDEYMFTPVLVNVANNTFQRFLQNKWLDEAIKPYN